MIASSLFSWAFLGAGLIFCTVLLNQYEVYPDLTISEVFGGSILASLGFATLVSLVARRHAFSRMLERMTAGPIDFSRVLIGFVALCHQMGIQRVSLQEAAVGNAFSLSLNGRGVVAISSDLTESLSPDETDAVLAHELSHIKNGDSAAKGVARLARTAFPFDPVLRLVEAAVHRERELWADRVSVYFTGKPLALASALIKANSGAKTGITGPTAGLFVGASRRGLLSLYPNLEKRVDTLVELAHQMELIPRPVVA